jgi:hypothetical protein
VGPRAHMGASLWALQRIETPEVQLANHSYTDCAIPVLGSCSWFKAVAVAKNSVTACNRFTVSTPGTDLYLLNLQVTNATKT